VPRSPSNAPGERPHPRRLNRSSSSRSRTCCRAWGVEEIEGNANPGAAQINLRFALGTDMKNALVEVIGRLNRLRPLPKDADRPIVTLGGGDGNANETLTWFFVQQLPGTPGTIESQRRFIDDTVRPRIEAVPGVAAVKVNEGPPDDVRITVDLARA